MRRGWRFFFRIYMYKSIPIPLIFTIISQNKSCKYIVITAILRIMKDVHNIIAELIFISASIQ